LCSGLGCAFAGLCYAEFAAMIPLAGSAYTYAYATLGELFAWIIGWDLTLEYAMGASTVSSGWSNYFIEFLRMFGLKLPLWMAYDHWTGLKMATDFVARQMVTAANPGFCRDAGVPAEAGRAEGAPTPDLLAQAAQLLNAPHIFGVAIGFNLPAFLIAMVITTILVIGIKRARSSTRDRGGEGFGGAVCSGAGLALCEPRELGDGLDTRLRRMASRGSGWRRGIFSSRISASTRCRRRRRRRRIRSAICRSGSFFRWRFARCCISAWRRCLTGMVPWQEVNIEAPIGARLSGPELNWASEHYHVGGLAGLTSVMLVMLLGQSRVLYAMANDGLLPKSSLLRCIRSFIRRGRARFWPGCWRRLWARSRRSTISARW
jgi:APA family basic amino acid/polyamine antiporter